MITSYKEKFHFLLDVPMVLPLLQILIFVKSFRIEGLTTHIWLQDVKALESSIIMIYPKFGGVGSL